MTERLTKRERERERERKPASSIGDGSEESEKTRALRLKAKGLLECESRISNLVIVYISKVFKSK